MWGRWATYFYGAALVTLPMVGVGVLKLATGRDWGGGLQPSWLFLALAIICRFGELLQRGRVFKDIRSLTDDRTSRWWLIGGLGILVSVLLSVAGLWLAPASEAMETVLGRFGKQVAQLAIMGCFAAWPAWWTRGSDRWSWTVKMLMIGGCFQIFYGLLQGLNYYADWELFGRLDDLFTSNPSIFSGSGELYLGDAFRNVPRIRGTVCEPLYLGNYLLMLLPLAMVATGSVWLRRLVTPGLLILLLATWSRGAWLGLVGQVILAVALLSFTRSAGPWGIGGLKRVWVWALGVVAILMLVTLIGLVTGWEGLLFPYRRLVQTFSGQDWSNLTRLYSMQAAWRAWLLSPVVGIGWGQFGWHFPALVDPLGLQSQFTWPVVNNFPLLVLCETGLVGFSVLIAWGLGLGRAAVRRWRDPGSNLDLIVLLATILAFFGVWLQMLTFSQYNLPHIWVSLGLLLAALKPEPDARSRGLNSE